MNIKFDYTRRQLLSTAVGAACSLQLSAQTQPTLRASLIRAYKDMVRRAISPDGKLLCLWGSRSPIESVRANAKGATRIPADRTSDVLSVVDRDTGSLVFSMSAPSPANGGAFFGEGRELYFYLVLLSDSPLKAKHILINIEKGEKAERPAPVLPTYEPLRNNRLLSVDADKDIVVVELPQYKLVQRVPLGESATDRWKRVSDRWISDDRNLLVYGLDQHRVLCRSVDDLSSVRWVHRADQRRFAGGIRCVVISPNAKFVAIAVAQTTNISQPGEVLTRILMQPMGER